MEWFIIIGFILCWCFVSFILIPATVSSKRLLKKGIPVTAIIKDVQNAKTLDKNEKIVESKVKIICEFDYEGHHEKELAYNYKLGVVAIGDKIKCLYDSKTNTLSTIENAKTSSKVLPIALLMPVIFIAIGVGMSLLETINGYLVGYVFLLFFFIVGFYIYRKDQKLGDYKTVDGIIKDVQKSYETYTDGGSYDVYAPIFEFKYNGKTYVHASNMFTTSKDLYNKIGSHVKIYYNPKTGKCLEKEEAKGYRTLGISFMAFSVIVAIILIIQQVLGK